MDQIVKSIHKGKKSSWRQSILSAFEIVPSKSKATTLNTTSQFSLFSIRYVNTFLPDKFSPLKTPIQLKYSYHMISYRSHLNEIFEEENDLGEENLEEPPKNPARNSVIEMYLSDNDSEEETTEDEIKEKKGLRRIQEDSDDDEDDQVVFINRTVQPNEGIANINLSPLGQIRNSRRLSMNRPLATDVSPDCDSSDATSSTLHFRKAKVLSTNPQTFGEGIENRNLTSDLELNVESLEQIVEPLKEFSVENEGEDEVPDFSDPDQPHPADNDQDNSDPFSTNESFRPYLQIQLSSSSLIDE
jgi:hypothetical protein